MILNSWIQRFIGFVRKDGATASKWTQYIHIKDGTVTATNGSIYIQRNTENEIGTEYLIPPQALKHIFASARRGKEFPFNKAVGVQSIGESIRLFTGDQQETINIDCRIPAFAKMPGDEADLNKFIPHRKPILEIRLDSKLLVMLDTLREGKDMMGVTFSFYGQDQPVAFKTDQYRGIVMPMRMF
jgi:hypothetical protein